MKKIIGLLFLLGFGANIYAQQWLGSNDGNGKIYRTGKIKVGTGPLYLDWTYESNWGGNSGKWSGYIGFNAFRNNDDLKDKYFGENQYTSKLVFEGSNAGFRWLYRAPVNNDSHVQHTLNELMVLSPDGKLGIGAATPEAKIETGSIAVNDPAFKTMDFQIAPNLSGGGWNSISQPSDIGLIFKNGKALVIAPHSSSISGLRITSGGNVGIGTANPKAILDVGAEISNGKLGTVFGRLTEGTGSGEGTFLGVRGYNSNVVNGESFAIEHSFYGQVNSSIDFHRGGDVTGGFISFRTNNNVEKLRITSNGNVGIGTTTPSQKLTVKGTVYSTEVKVDVNAGTGPDYVFEPTYNLPTLAETEAYIKANKHLPEVPSAKEMEANGINLSEMNMLLLKKVEELTLYQIEAARKMELLENQIQKLIKK